MEKSDLSRQRLACFAILLAALDCGDREKADHYVNRLSALGIQISAYQITELRVIK
ncbi:hypothetical protein U8335_26780 [Roseiconus lacunae]|uniref:hypothetical protein n=1 Tax=Roseiconus lacunae TaxID=2605694 RepID=UPI00308C2E3F|nr:hypothetical protein U8335_26780 [Stieleria sp. HD01]